MMFPMAKMTGIGLSKNLFVKGINRLLRSRWPLRCSAMIIFWRRTNACRLFLRAFVRKTRSSFGKSCTMKPSFSRIFRNCLIFLIKNGLSRYAFAFFLIWPNFSACPTAVFVCFLNRERCGIRLYGKCHRNGCSCLTIACKLQFTAV